MSDSEVKPHSKTPELSSFENQKTIRFGVNNIVNEDVDFSFELFSRKNQFDHSSEKSSNIVPSENGVPRVALVSDSKFGFFSNKKLDSTFNFTEIKDEGRINLADLFLD